jgi:hypothetical protein
VLKRQGSEPTPTQDDEEGWEEEELGEGNSMGNVAPLPTSDANAGTLPAYVPVKASELRELYVRPRYTDKDTLQRIQTYMLQQGIIGAPCM